jgi:hypothetical protein
MVTLNKPELMNAIDQGVAADVLDICRRIEEDGPDLSGNLDRTVGGSARAPTCLAGRALRSTARTLSTASAPLRGSRSRSPGDARIGSQAARFVTVFQERNRLIDEACNIRRSSSPPG